MIELPIDTINLPEKWVIQPLIEVAELQRGISWRKIDETNESGTLVVSIPNIKDGYIDFESKYNHYLKIDIPESKKLKIGDILCVGSSGSVHNVGRNSKITWLPFDNIAFASFTFVCRFLKGRIDNDFLYYILNSNLVPFEKFTKRAADGKYNFQLREFESRMRIPVPPLPEQRKIAYILSTVQKAIEQQDKLIRTTTELKKALMQKLFTEGLPMAGRGVRFSNPEGSTTRKLKQTEIGPVPEDWEVVEINKLFDIQQGKQVSKSNRIGDNQKPFLRTANVFWGKIDFSELDYMNFSLEEEKKYKIEQGDLLVCEGGDVGRTAIWEYQVENIYYQNHLHRLRRISNEIIPKYFMYWMNFIVVETSYVKDAGNKTTIPNLSKSRLGRLLFPKPPVDYQLQSVNMLEGMDKKIQFHQKKKQTLSALFKTLLHELMTGQRRVHEIEFEALNADIKEMSTIL